jgi:hypothetical protein
MQSEPENTHFLLQILTLWCIVNVEETFNPSWKYICVVSMFMKNQTALQHFLQTSDTEFYQKQFLCIFNYPRRTKIEFYIHEKTLLTEFQFWSLPATKSTIGLNICLKLLVYAPYRPLRAAVQEDSPPEFCDGLLSHPFQCASHNPSITRQACVTCAAENRQNQSVSCYAHVMVPCNDKLRRLIFFMEG